jgi:putative sterol carrier protein
MSDNNIINSLLSSLGGNDKQFVKTLDKIIKVVVKLINTTEELKEELLGLDDIYQTYIKDVDYNYWLEVSNGRLDYSEGVNPKAKFKMIFTKMLIIKILKGEESGVDDFMKGKINVEGDLSQGLRYIKLTRLLFEYLSKMNDKNN